MRAQRPLALTTYGEERSYTSVRCVKTKTDKMPWNNWTDLNACFPLKQLMSAEMTMVETAGLTDLNSHCLPLAQNLTHVPIKTSAGKHYERCQSNFRKRVKEGNRMEFSTIH